MRHGLRRKKRKGESLPTHWPLDVASGPPSDPSSHVVGWVGTDANDHPVGFTGLRLHPPPILTGAPVPAKVDYVVISDQRMMSAFWDSGIVETGQAVLVGQFNPYKFAQLLTKIAYSFAVAKYGYQSFTSLVHPILKGTAETWADLVGGDFELPPATHHLVSLKGYVVVGRSARYVVVMIRLWAFLGSPVYRVVVGTI